MVTVATTVVPESTSRVTPAMRSSLASITPLKLASFQRVPETVRGFVAWKP